MTIPNKVSNFLVKNKVKYEQVQHRTVYTAYDKAATLKVPEKIIGKTLALNLDGKLALVLIPANKNLDKNKLKKAVKAKKLEFVSERVIKNKFKGVKIGALPPLGEIWNLSTFADRTLLKEKNIFVNSGVREISLKISPKILEKLKTVPGNFSMARK